jgi:hypothetical protein
MRVRVSAGGAMVMVNLEATSAAGQNTAIATMAQSSVCGEMKDVLTQLEERGVRTQELFNRPAGAVRPELHNAKHATRAPKNTQRPDGRGETRKTAKVRTMEKGA